MLNNNDFNMNGNNLAKANLAIDSIILQLKQEAIHGKIHLILLNPPAKAGGNSWKTSFDFTYQAIEAGENY